MGDTTPTVIDNFFTEEQIAYLTTLPETIKANADLLKSAPTSSPSFLSSVDFTVQLTPDIQESILANFGINLPLETQIPMKWIVGNIPEHYDNGATEFNNTYLVYLNDSGSGNLIIADVAYAITKNRGLKFSEGLPHYTDNTFNAPRLIMGPMDELGNKVGIPSQTALYYIDIGGNTVGLNNSTSYVVGDLDPTTIAPGYNQNYTTWFIDDTNASGQISSLNRFYTNGDVLIGNVIDNFSLYLMKAVIFSIYYYPTYTDAQNQTNLLGFNCSRSVPYYTVGTLNENFADYTGLCPSYMTSWKIYQQTGEGGSSGGDTIYRNGDVLNGILDSGFSNTYVLYNVNNAPQPMTMKSVFTDNSRVYYKAGSLASGGVGTVKNSRRKSRFT